MFVIVLENPLMAIHDIYTKVTCIFQPVYYVKSFLLSFNNQKDLQSYILRSLTKKNAVQFMHCILIY